jgi:hypothetical protein
MLTDCHKKQVSQILVLLLSSVMISCGGGSDAPPAADTYTVGGMITGLNGNLVLRNTNTTQGSSEDFTTAAATFTFSTALDDQDEYAVTILTNPVGQSCTVDTNGSGRVNGANVTDVAVSCSDNPPPPPPGDSGSFDPSFGTDGKVTTDFSGPPT